MPGLTAAPLGQTDSVVVQHDSAGDFLAVAFPTLYRHEASANIVLAHALKQVSAEAALAGYQFTCDSDVEEWLEKAAESSFEPHAAIKDCFWLTLWSRPSESSSPTLEMVVSCLSWTLGNYPVFFWTPPRKQDEHFTKWIAPRISQLAEHLRCCVPSERVFSVFGMKSLVKAFSKYWSGLTEPPVKTEQFYAALLSYCDRTTFKKPDAAVPANHRLRRAISTDLAVVAQLCKEFADDSVHFPLSFEAAKIEADELISKGQIWVDEMEGEVTTICAVTRTTLRVAAITKVYTASRFRKKGCAGLLVRHVTEMLLFQCGKDKVVLYVGHGNSAQRVYHKVGFVGLCREDLDAPRPEGVEDSLELGFDGTNRGHW